ncbi:AP2/ERF and B3 domain-containing transcription factor At1g51120-like [Impatiens glandulifera]|uniref:AP2/ERF and B3 domain-containing transcription factor At1g51120-like n=1 Tax=Impatiens glandulifera TaxID=253017 RepID=UPI001FB0935B|nr:AP2/ERF and B3 domain-containing transcription factor At1g51120-like [Impatiens glandulifera]
MASMGEALDPVGRNIQFSRHTKFKGVVIKPNGHWGAQIYANHHRVWLGTFKTENEAARAYDSAAIRLREGDSQRNFPWTDTTQQEPLFQNDYTTEMILQMIKDGSYPLKFADFLTNKRYQEKTSKSRDESMHDENGYVSQTLMFQKELTLSDVGKLNRLVIPKRYAIRYFPSISEEHEDENTRADETILTFLDMKMRTWRFRYCYWKSSQSYVLTKGWNRFVKENKLKEKDMVVFSSCKYLDGQDKGHTFFMIGVTNGHDQMDHNLAVGTVDSSHEYAQREELHIDGGGLEPNNVVEPKVDHEGSENEAIFEDGLKNVVRIFGVEITSQY